MWSTFALIRVGDGRVTAVRPRPETAPLFAAALTAQQRSRPDSNRRSPGVRLLARITDGAALVLRRAIDLLMTPGKTVWNCIASFDRARELRLQPIAVTETRIIRVPSSEIDSVEDAVR